MLQNPTRRTRTASAALVATVATVGGLVVGVATSAPAQADVLSAGGDFVSTPTTTILDSRNSTPLTQDVARPVTVALPNVDMNTVSAVLVSATVINPSGAGYLSASPAGASSNGTSSINFYVGAPTSNTAVVALSKATATRNQISFTLGVAATADLLVNVQGYYTAATSGSGTPGGLVSVDHQRVFDTRNTDGKGGVPHARVAGGASLTVDLSGVAALPAGTPSAYLDLIVEGSTTGYIQVRADGAASTTASRVNFRPGDTAQGIAVPLSSARKFVLTVGGMAASDAVDLIGTLEGYTAASPTAGGGFRASQARLAANVPLAAGASVDVQVGGRNGLPLQGIAGAALNVVAAASTAVGTLAAYPTGGTSTGTSLTNYRAGENTADFAILKPGTDGKITFVNRGSAAVNLYVDQQGWFDALTTTIGKRDYSAVAAVQLPANAGDTSAVGALVFSWVDNNGQLRINQEDTPGDFSSIKSVTVGSTQQVRGPADIAVDGSSVQTSVQGVNTDALVKDGPQDSKNILTWQTNPYTDFGGSMAGAPVIARNLDGTLTLFAVDTSGALWRLDESDASPAWTRVPGAPALTTAISVQTTTRGVQIAAVTTGKAVSTALFSGGVVSAWTALGGSSIGDRPAIIAESGGAVRIVVRQGTKVLTKQQNANNTFPSAWTTLSAPVGTTGVVGAPTGVLDPATGFNAIVVRAGDANDTQLWIAYETGQSTGVFGSFEQIGGTTDVRSDPTAVSYYSNSKSSYQIAWRNTAGLQLSAPTR